MRDLSATELLPAFLWALSILAAAVLFKGSPSAPWIETSLLGLAVTFVVLPKARRCRRPS